MLKRQKAILDLLVKAGRPLSSTVFVKLVFLLRHETDLKEGNAFYDFLPYKFGPFSFTLYWDLNRLVQNGYVTREGERIALCHWMLDDGDQKSEDLPQSIRQAVTTVISQYGRLNQRTLVERIYAKYPWYAMNSELADPRLKASQRPPWAQPAIYTTGYEGKSVDFFFNDLLSRGIKTLIDVRANPISRKYGFAGRRLKEIGEKLGIGYWHVPSLGIPREYRENLDGFKTYQRLLDWYEQKILPAQETSMLEVAKFMKSRPAVFVCAEKDFRCCHRSRLAKVVSQENGLEEVHL